MLKLKRSPEFCTDWVSSLGSVLKIKQDLLKDIKFRFLLSGDTSSQVIRGCLMQDIKGTSHPVAYLTRTLQVLKSGVTSLLLLQENRYEEHRNSLTKDKTTAH